MAELACRSRVELINFTDEPRPRRVEHAERISQDGVVISRCVLQPNPEGDALGSTQLAVVLHDGAPFEMGWCLPERGRKESRRMVAGDIHINPANRPIHQHWTIAPRVLVMALEPWFVDDVVAEAFEGGASTLRTVIGTRDPVIENMAAFWRRELDEGGAGGRLWAEGLGTLLAVHLFREYSDGIVPRIPLIGGLGAIRLRRVVEYIDAHLSEDLSLHELAGVAGLSAHHFGEAFRISTGRPPHRFVIERRIDRAKSLLIGSEATIAGISLAVGFASHSHFAVNFRKLTGATPSRFRQDRR